MCLKYNLQPKPDCDHCDGSSRPREMAAAHHTFLIDCETGVCICLSGDPTGPSSASSQDAARTPMSRSLLRTCLANCVKEQQMEADQRQAPGAGPMPGERRARRRVSSMTPPKAGQQTELSKSLRDSLKRCLWRLASCVRAH